MNIKELNNLIDLHKDLYLDIVLEELSDIRKNSKNSGDRMKCCKCGSLITLHKIDNDTYICDKCYKELKTKINNKLSDLNKKGD